MLTRKNLIIVLAVLVVLVAVSVLQKARHSQSTSHAASIVLVEGELARADLDRIELGFAGEAAVVLTRADPAWRVATAHDARADHQKIDTLLQNLSGLRGEFRSDSGEVLADYGFTDSTTVTLRGYQGDREVFALELGNKPSGGQGGFVKRPGSSEVYLCTTGLLGNLGLWGGPERPQNRHFLDLLAHQADKADVAALQLTGDQDLSLQREFAMITPADGDTINTEPYADPSTWEWKLADGTMVQKTKADNIMNTAANLRAQDVADPTVGLATYGLQPAARTLTLVMADGSQTVMRFGDERPAEGKTPGGVYALLGDDPTVWVIGTYNLGNLFKTRDELLPE